MERRHQTFHVAPRARPFHVAPRAENAPALAAAVMDEEPAVRAAQVYVLAAVPAHPYENSPRFVSKFAEIRERIRRDS